MTEHGIFPTDWTKTHDWQGFFDAHRDVLAAATDFLTHGKTGNERSIVIS